MLTLYLLIGALFGIACAGRWLPEDKEPEDYISTAAVSCLYVAIWPQKMPRNPLTEKP